MEEILICPQKDFLGNRLFDTSNPALNREGTLRPFFELRKELATLGFEVKTADMSQDIPKAKAVFFLEMPKRGDAFYKACLDARMQERMHLLLFEPPATRPDNYEPQNHSNFAKVHTWRDDLVDGKKYFKNNFVMPYFASEKIELPKKEFSSKKLLCLVSANKYSTHPDQLYTERVRAIRFMEKNHPADFDLYGQRWDLPVIHSNLAESLMLNNISKALYKLGKNSPTMLNPRWLYPSFKGGIASKIEAMSGYKFSICYENQKEIKGYVSEKIMDSMLSGCVPVYLGASNIADHVPKECFVDLRDFESYEKLYSHLSSMDEKAHSEHLKHIREYLNSKKSHEYKIDFLLELVKKAIQ